MKKIIVKVQRSLYPRDQICVYSENKENLCITVKHEIVEYVKNLMDEDEFKCYFSATISKGKFNLHKKVPFKYWPEW